MLFLERAFQFSEHQSDYIADFFVIFLFSIPSEQQGMQRPELTFNKSRERFTCKFANGYKFLLNNSNSQSNIPFQLSWQNPY